MQAGGKVDDAEVDDELQKRSEGEGERDESVSQYDQMHFLITHLGDLADSHELLPGHSDLQT